VVIWTLILTKMLWRRLKNTDEIGVNDIDDETPTASDNDDDSDTTIDYEQAAQFAVAASTAMTSCHHDVHYGQPGVDSSRERSVCFARTQQ